MTISPSDIIALALGTAIVVGIATLIIGAILDGRTIDCIDELNTDGRFEMYMNGRDCSRTESYWVDSLDPKRARLSHSQALLRIKEVRAGKG